MRVVNVFDLMKAGRFVRYQDCDHLKFPDASSMVVLFSHRWETLHDPDPTGIQYHGAIRFAIKSCMMACGSTPNVFNSVDFSELVMSPQLFKWLAHEYQLLLTSLNTSSAGIAPLQNDEDLVKKSGLLMTYLIHTLGRQNAMLVFKDVPIVAWLMRKLDFWYDFACMPQRPRSPDQETGFQSELNNLHRYFLECSTCVHWSSVSLKRAWCLMEGLLSLQADRQSLFCAENSLISSQKDAHIHEVGFGTMMQDDSAGPLVWHEVAEDVHVLYRRDLKRVDLSAAWRYNVAKDIRNVGRALRGKTPIEIFNYLKTHHYSTTEEKDLFLIAGALSKHLH